MCGRRRDAWRWVVAVREGVGVVLQGTVSAAAMLAGRLAACDLSLARRRSLREVHSAK